QPGYGVGRCQLGQANGPTSSGRANGSCRTQVPLDLFDSALRTGMGVASATDTAAFACRVATAFRAAALRVRVTAAFLPAARAFLVLTVFFPAARTRLFFEAFLAAAERPAAFFAAMNVSLRLANEA